MISLAQIQWTVQREWNISNKRHSLLQRIGCIADHELGPAFAEIEANTVASFSDAMIATIVIDPSSNRVQHLDWETGESEGGIVDEDKAMEEPKNHIVEELNNYAIIVERLLQAFRNSSQISIQRVSEVPRAIVIKGCRLELDNLMLSEHVENLRVRIIV